jgi:hypothetical protein
MIDVVEADRDEVDVMGDTKSPRRAPRFLISHQLHTSNNGRRPSLVLFLPVKRRSLQRFGEVLLHHYTATCLR